MTELFVLGASPAEEDVAQLGRTPDFARPNCLEVDCYQAALIAHYGPPPSGARFVRHGSNHDFGHYIELALRFDLKDEAASAYAMLVDEGLRRWSHAGFTAPVEYPSSTSPMIHHADLVAAIRSAISIMRPPFPDGERAIANLRAHYPDIRAATSTALSESGRARSAPGATAWVRPSSSSRPRRSVPAVCESVAGLTSL